MKASRSPCSRSSEASKISIAWRQRSGVMTLGPLGQSRIAPGPRALPLAFHGRDRDVEHVAALFECQAGEKPQFDEPASSLVDDGKLRKRIVQVENGDIERRTRNPRIIERNLDPVAVFPPRTLRRP